MFTPAPIDKDFVPYNKRPVLKRNAGLFVDGTGGRGRGASRVVPQSIDCAGQSTGTACGVVYTSGGQQYRRTCSSDGECTGPLVQV